VQKALLRWEPRVDVLNVRTESHPETPNTLLIHVDYRIRANNASHSLVYPFFINEGQG
jgi:phage baseplate assembly protein W